MNTPTNADLAQEEKKDLKWGYSTGACTSALALGLWEYQTKGIFPKKVHFYFLDDKEMNVPLLDPVEKDGELFLRIQKDGGDDPDCTHKAILYASLKEVQNLDVAHKEDYILTIGKNTLILHTHSGIGLCTRLGFDCDQGKWAINTGPRAMLMKNLEHVGFGQNDSTPRTWLFTLGVEEGETLAKNTLNPLLGIVNGISILGTTGHVKPYSHAAYIETIRICVRSQSLAKNPHMVFSTGGRTQKAAIKYYPDLEETAFVSIGDFIAESIRTADKHNMQKVSIACMAGKLCKYAAGFEYTHAHNVQQDMNLLRGIITTSLHHYDDELAPLTEEGIKNIYASINEAQSVREALLYIPEGTRMHVLEQLAEKAFTFFHSLVKNIDFGILLCDFNGDILFEKRSIKSTKDGVHND